MQHIVDRFVASSIAFGFRISLTKTKKRISTVTGELHIKSIITCQGNILAVVEPFNWEVHRLAHWIVKFNYAFKRHLWSMDAYKRV